MMLVKFETIVVFWLVIEILMYPKVQGSFWNGTDRDEKILAHDNVYKVNLVETRKFYIKA